jgi:regulator of sigma E protease
VGMCLIAAVSFDPSLIGHYALMILAVAAGLGAVIFVHELGHFAVARMCGVKCEKFMIGFDIGGYKLSHKWGETEYGIGILPFGGYVKMLGQDDNPANIAEQLRESEVAGNAVETKAITGPDGKTYHIDKRSYLAKSVPQRMAIISAGVIMNVIFAFIFAVIAYKIGVPYNPSIVSRTGPGTPAWQADIRPGDEVVKIADVENPSFADLSASVSLGNIEAGIPFVIRRGNETLDKLIFPKQGRGMPRVGVAPPASLVIYDFDPDSPAADAKPKFEKGDEIVSADGQSVANFAEFSSYLVEHAQSELKVLVRRGGKPRANDSRVWRAPDAADVRRDDDPSNAGDKLEGGEFVEITLPPRPMKTLGLVMQMGKVVGVQEHSPAAGKIKPGDFIDSIADAAGSPGGAAAHQPLTFDPITLPEDLRRMAEDNRDVELSLRRKSTGEDGRQTSEPVVIPLRTVTWQEGPFGGENEPVVATALGVAYSVLSVVDRVEPGSPADAAGMKSGDVVTHAEFVFPDDMKDKPDVDPFEFSSDEDEQKANWPSLMAMLQVREPVAKVKLTYKRGDQMLEATLTPAIEEGYFLAERGLAFEPIQRIRTAKDWNEAFSRGWEETVSSLGLVYRFLGKLGTQVSVTSLGGPITIAKAAGFSAAEGPGKLLVFLTMLSANLAVINFLPIPLLDGGHMVFLLWEGIRGKPAGEKFVVAMHTVGFVFIITLMLFVISLDMGLIDRNL